MPRTSRTKGAPPIQWMSLRRSKSEATMSLAFLKPWNCISTSLRQSLEARTAITFVKYLKLCIYLPSSKPGSRDSTHLRRSIESSPFVVVFKPWWLFFVKPWSHCIDCLCESLEVTTPLAFVEALNLWCNIFPSSKPWSHGAACLRQNLKTVMSQARIRQCLEANFLRRNAYPSTIYLAL